MPITQGVNPATILKHRRLAAAVLAFALIPAGTADAATTTTTKHRKPKAKKAVVTAVAKPPVAKVALAPAPVAAPAPAPAPTFTSVISIGGYVFYNLTYAQAVEAYAAAVAAAPPGYVPPPVTSISVNTTVGGNA